MEKTTDRFFSLRLFLGVSLSDRQVLALDKIDPIVRSCFIKGVEDAVYLTQVEFSGQRYLGKYVPTPFPIKELGNIEKNIMSLIERVLPFQKPAYNPLQLIPLTVNE